MISPIGKILLLLEHLQNHIKDFEKVNTDFSQGSVGWHIDHSLLVIIAITETLKKSNPQDYQWKFSISRLFVYTFNKIPRGRGKAPKVVMPKDEISSAVLQQRLQTAQERLAMICDLHKNNFFIHPYFGKLNTRDAVKFLQLHTQHHLHIITDIKGKN